MSLTKQLKKLMEDPMFYYTGFEMSENHPDKEDHEKRTRRDEENCGYGKDDDEDDTPEEYLIRRPI